MSRHILIVDDDAVIRILLSRHLTGLGYTCSIAADGEAALAILGERRVQVLITDLEMPGMDGLDLLRHLRALGVPTRAVVVSGHATVNNLISCIREGAVALVPKPLDDLTLLDQVVAEAFVQMQRWTDQIKGILALRDDTRNHRALP